MSHFKYGHASGDDWKQAAIACLAQIGAIPATATLGFVYATDVVGEHLDELLRLLRASTGVQQWLGTVGVGICATGAEYYDRPAIAVMLAELPNDAFRVFTVPEGDLAQFDALHGAWIGDRQPYLGLVHGDPACTEVEDLVDALAGATSAGFLVGGLGSARGTVLSVASQVTEAPVSGAFFTDAVIVSTALTQGCTPIGPTRVITECERNILIGIDDRSAFEVLREDIGEALAEDLGALGGVIFAGLPIRGSDTGDYIVRNLVGIDPNNGLLAIAELVERDQPLVFCRRDATTARQDLDRMLVSLQRRIARPPRGGIYVSCVGRGTHLFGTSSDELKQIRATLGDLPIVGFYANGEISRNRIYGYTGVLTLFL